MAAPRMSRADRVLAWLLTGPVGHFVGGVLDWFSLLGQLAWARLRGSRPGD